MKRVVLSVSSLVAVVLLAALVSLVRADQAEGQGRLDGPAGPEVFAPERLGDKAVEWRQRLEARAAQREERTRLMGERMRALGIEPPASAEGAPRRAPGITNPSINVNGDVLLGPDSNVFKDGTVLLWDDDSSLGVGRGALQSETTSSTGNTALGTDALLSNDGGIVNTASGFLALLANTTGGFNTAHGSYSSFLNQTGDGNTAIGSLALLFNQTSSSNTAVGYSALVQTTYGPNTAVGSGALQRVDSSRSTAVGYRALNNATYGSFNTALGHRALYSLETGYSNTALGYAAGFFVNGGTNNIHIGNYGFLADNATTRIGAFQTSAYIYGIRGVTTGIADAVPVVIDSDSQLGTLSSSRRVKEDIHDMAGASDRLLALRPVTFRYRKATKNGEKPIQYGLIAEEVAETFPELVVYDDQGRPETVKYHLLSVLLINELQKQRREIAELRSVEARLAHLEALSSSQQPLTVERRGRSSP